MYRNRNLTQSFSMWPNITINGPENKKKIICIMLYENDEKNLGMGSIFSNIPEKEAKIATSKMEYEIAIHLSAVSMSP